MLDPPEDFFRARLVITLLETCGHYFDRGSSKRKLDRFLIYFQRYILSKGALPLDIEFDIQVSLTYLLLQFRFFFIALAIKNNIVAENPPFLGAGAEAHCPGKANSISYWYQYPAYFLRLFLSLFCQSAQTLS